MKQITSDLTTVYTNPNRPYTVTGWAPVEDNPVKSELDITYTAGERPSVITQDGKKAVLTYNANHDRIRMQFSVNDSIRWSRYYLGGNYEVDENVVRTKEKLYLGGGYYDAPAVWVKEGNNASVYFIHRDYLGSILQIVDTQGNIVEENSFDAWGCRRNPANQRAFVTGTAPELVLDRGYTGHEHLSFFGLINMNARLYDPLLGRFLSPDPYVQMPDFTQAYNRYGYCMNSPLCYVDQSGEFFLGYTFGFFKGLFTGKNPFKTGWQSGVNEVKLWGGLFTTDSRKNFGGQAWEMISRFTWQGAQTFFGLGFATVSNWAGQVDEVDYWGGATVSRGANWGSGAVTLSSYITGNRNLKADPNNYLFQHEYGHYLQSQEMGPGYIPTVGIPSIKSAAGNGDHSLEKFEQDANRRAFNYFNDPKNGIEGFYTSEEDYEKYKKLYQFGNLTKGWNFYRNPLDVNGIGKGSRETYYDYHKSGAIKSSNMTLRMFWLKY